MFFGIYNKKRGCMLYSFSVKDSFLFFRIAIVKNAHIRCVCQILFQKRSLHMHSHGIVSINQYRAFAILTSRCNISTKKNNVVHTLMTRSWRIANDEVGCIVFQFHFSSI